MLPVSRRRSAPSMYTPAPLATNDQNIIRIAARTDVAAIRRIAVTTGLFAADELDGFDEILAGFLDGTLDGHVWLVLERDDEVIGAAYFAPEPFSDRVFNLYFIGVSPAYQGGGTGGALIADVEQRLRDMGEQVARILIVETSGLAIFEPTRAFYRKRGFVEEARIREYYGPDDDKVVFWKSLHVGQ